MNIAAVNTHTQRRTSGSDVLLTNDKPSCKHSTAIGRKCSPSVRASTPRVSKQILNLLVHPNI